MDHMFESGCAQVARAYRNGLDATGVSAHTYTRTMGSSADIDGSGEVRALARLGLTELSAATVGVARVHQAVSAVVFGAMRATAGRRIEPVRAAHDIVSEATYTSVTTVLDSARIVADALPETTRQPTRTVRGAALIGVLDGLIGDALDDEGSPLAPAMAVRVDGAPVARTPAALESAFPAATGHLVVFVHGLMETEHAWRVGDRRTYGTRLAADIGATEVQVRYNSGRRIADNGAALSELLTAIVLQWPVPVTRVSLVGHSMGGLVIRSACARGSGLDASWTRPESPRSASASPSSISPSSISAASALPRSAKPAPWVPLVTETVSLGSPHLGAPLAKGVHTASAALRVLSVTRPFGELLRRRSAGIRDLYHGTPVADGTDPDAFWQQPGTDVALLATARHLFVTASLFGGTDHVMGRLIGDGLVLTPSGRGFRRSRHIGFRDEDGMHLPHAHHFTLLNHEAIYDWLRTGLRPRRALTAG